MDDKQRKEQIEELIEVYSYQSDREEILKAIPQENVDKEDKKFVVYYTYIQLLIMFTSSVSVQDKCELYADIMQMKKMFTLPIPTIEAYKDIC